MRVRWRNVPAIGAMLAFSVMTSSVPLAAQVRTIDPNQAIDSDLRSPGAAQAPSYYPPAPVGTPTSADVPHYPDQAAPSDTAPVNPSAYPAPQDPAPQNPATPDQTAQDVARTGADAESASSQTFQREEVFAAAEGTFGKGASGLAGILERTLKEQGRPNAYIAGREASGAVVVGLRYGTGTMFHKVEGQQPVYWTGPSLGFDLGGDANKVFVLVYNLYDSEDLYKRFPAAEGRVYFVGGFAATYLRRGNIVLIPIRLGVGWRQGINVGYMKFSHKSRWFPF